MKIRSGFVANSSSSSFILGCDSIPSNYLEAGLMWFGENAVDHEALRHMFEEFKPIQIDFDRMLSRTINEKFSELTNCIEIEDDPDFNLTDSLLSEILYNIHFYQKYTGECEFRRFESKQIHKFFAATDIDENDMSWEDRSKLYDNIKDAYYEDKKQLLIDGIQKFIDTFKGCNVLMSAEFGDHTHYGSLCEQGDHWDNCKNVWRFSHH